MKANDLMIGDWVGFLPTWKNEDGSIDRDGDPNDPIPFKVEMVCRDCVDLDDREGGSFDADDISLYPIPLTRKILENNGWSGRSHTQWQFFRDGCDELNILLGKNYTEVEYLNMIYNPEDNAEVNYGHNSEFPRTIYVHELQHLLRLCGIEKEIEL